MKLTNFNQVMLVGISIFGSIFFYTLFFLSPEDGIFTKISFLISLFIFIFCLLGLLLFLIKKKASNNEIVHLYIKSSLRQGFFIALFVIFSLLLSMINLFTWWDALLLAFSLILIELYFKSGKMEI